MLSEAFGLGEHSRSTDFLWIDLCFRSLLRAVRNRCLCKYWTHAVTKKPLVSRFSVIDSVENISIVDAVSSAPTLDKVRCLRAKRRNCVESPL